MAMKGHKTTPDVNACRSGFWEWRLPYIRSDGTWRPRLLRQQAHKQQPNERQQKQCTGGCYLLSSRIKQKPIAWKGANRGFNQRRGNRRPNTIQGKQRPHMPAIDQNANNEKKGNDIESCDTEVKNRMGDQLEQKHKRAVLRGTRI